MRPTAEKIKINSLPTARETKKMWQLPLKVRTEKNSGKVHLKTKRNTTRKQIGYDPWKRKSNSCRKRTRWQLTKKRKKWGYVSQKGWTSHAQPSPDGIPNLWVKQLDALHNHYARAFNELIRSSLNTRRRKHISHPKIWSWSWKRISPQEIKSNP